MTRTLFSISALLGALLLSGISAAASPPPPLTIGVLASLTGNWAEICKNFDEGITLAGEEVNAAGGIQDGRQIVFEFQDTDEEKSGAKVVTAFRYFRSEGVKYFIGPSGVPGILALTPVAKSDNIVLIQPTATGSYQQASENFFNGGGDNAVTTSAAAKRLFELGVRKVGIFGSLQPWEEQQAKTFEESFLKFPGASISESVYPLADQKDLRLEALKLVRGKPDGVFYANYNNVALAAAALGRLHYGGKAMTSSLDDSHLTGSEGALEGAEVYLFSPPSAEFVSKYKKRFGHAPGLFSDTGYDAALALLLAIKKAGADEPGKVREALKALKFKGSSGQEHHFDSNRLIDRGITLYQVQNGQVLPKQQP